MLKMTTLLLVLATLVAFVQCFPEPSAGAELKCLEDNNISREELRDTFPLFTKNGKEVDRKYKCFAKCLLTIFTLRKEDGKFDVAKFLEGDHNPKVHEIMTKVTNNCVEKFELEEDDCEYSFNTLSCIMVDIEEKRKQNDIKEEILKVF